MSPKKVVSGDDVLARQMKDRAFRAERDATSLARAVAIEVVKYRATMGFPNQRWPRSSACPSQSWPAWNAATTRPPGKRWAASLAPWAWSSSSRSTRLPAPDSVKSADGTPASKPWRGFRGHSVTTAPTRDRQYRV